MTTPRPDAHDSTLRALREAVLNNPPDDTPRLVYADRLDELAGDETPRAEFIRVGCAVARGEGIVPRENPDAYAAYRAALKREKELFGTTLHDLLGLEDELPVLYHEREIRGVIHRRKWACYLKQSEDYGNEDRHGGARFHRGFCDQAGMYLRHVPTALGPLLGTHPVQRVFVEADEHRDDELGRGPVIEIEVHPPCGRRRKWNTYAATTRHGDEVFDYGDRDVWIKRWDSRDAMVVGVGKWAARAVAALARNELTREGGR